MTEAQLHRERIIQGLVNMLRRMPFQTEFKVKKKPAGIKIIVEVTQEQMDNIAKQTIDKAKTEEA